jgi:hypothetical protein
MRVTTVTKKADADGVLHLDLPVGTPDAEYELVLVVQPKLVMAAGRPLTQEDREGSPGYFEKVIGSIDDETFFPEVK